MFNKGERIIYHIDVNSAFLSWEAVYRLTYLGSREDLRGQLCAVGGDAAVRRGIILAKSIPAGRRGVRTGESILEARQKCPGLRIVPPHYRLYERCSAAFLELLREYTPDVEPYSIDEAYMEMTKLLPAEDREERRARAAETAKEIRERIRRELGFTVNVGISSCKLLAKMASDLEKPDRVHTLFPEEIEEKMWPLPVSALFFVGPAAEKRLHTMGIRTIGALAGTDPALLRAALKKHGEQIWSFANGREESPVLAEALPCKGYGNSTTTPFDVTEPAEARLVLLSLAETLGARLREAGVGVRRVSVELKDREFVSWSRQTTLEEATDITWELYRAACGLLEGMWDGRPLRHLGIRTGRPESRAGGRQLRLFESGGREKLERLDAMVDCVRRRYGADALRRAAFAGSGFDHMAGGISREKWVPEGVGAKSGNGRQECRRKPGARTRDAGSEAGRGGAYGIRI